MINMLEFQVGELLASKFADGLINEELMPQTYVSYAIVAAVSETRITLLAKVEHAHQQSKLKIYNISLDDYSRYTSIMYRHVQYA